MKTKLLIVLLLISNLVFCQPETYTIIPGTKCSMIPPADFLPASNFAGFQNNNTGASIMVSELPAPVQTLVASFTAPALKSKGMALLSKETVDFRNTKATLFKVSQQANGTSYLKYILLFGDNKKAVIVNGIYREEDKDVEPEMKKALLSTVYNEKQNDNPLEAVKFTIDVSAANLKLAKYIAGSIIYTADGKIPTEKPTLMVGSANATVPEAQQEKYCINRLKQLPGGDLMTIKTTNPVEIATFKGYEIIADGKNKKGNDETTYQVILFNENEYYIMVGMAAENIAENIKLFKSVAKTFQLK